MGLLNYFGFNKTEQKAVPTPVVPKNTNEYIINNLSSMSFATSELPIMKQKIGYKWVSFGANNDYPQQLIGLYHSSPILQAILNQKAQMISGNGIEYDRTINLDVKQKLALDTFLNNIDGERTLEELLDAVALDFVVFGGFALEVIWNFDHTRIIRVKKIDVSKLRCGEKIEDIICHYYFSNDWNSRINPNAVAIPTFDPSKKDETNQVIYTKSPSLGSEYYALPEFSACFNLIKADALIGAYYRSSLENGFSPSFIVNFFNNPESKQEKELIVQDIKRNFQGMSSGQKGLVFFNDGTENATTITPISVDNIDKILSVISPQIINNILSANRITSGELFGITVAGMGTTDLVASYKIFNSTVIVPQKLIIERLLNKLLKINGVSVNLKLKEFNPLGDYVPAPKTITPASNIIN